MPAPLMAALPGVGQLGVGQLGVAQLKARPDAVRSRTVHRGVTLLPGPGRHRTQYLATYFLE